MLALMWLLPLWSVFDNWRDYALALIWALLACGALPALCLKLIREAVPPPSYGLLAVGSAWLLPVPYLSLLLYVYLGIPPAHAFWLHAGFFLADLAFYSAYPIALYHGLKERRGRLPFVVTGCLAFVALSVCGPPVFAYLDVYARVHSPVPDAMKPSECGQSLERPLFAHISDLHISEKPYTRDGKIPGNARLPTLLKAIKDKNPRYLIISGDLTDEGTAEQWNIFEEMLRKNLGRDVQVLITTGNHDLNNFFGKDQVEDPQWSTDEKVNKLLVIPRIFRAATIQSQHLPNLMTKDGKRLASQIKDLPNPTNLNQFQSQITECVSACTNSSYFPSVDEQKVLNMDCRMKCPTGIPSITFHYYKDIGNSFPLYFVDYPTKTAFIAMTTAMGDSRSVGENAIGINGENQVKGLRKLLEALPAEIEHIILVQHHPLLWTKMPPFPRVHLHNIEHPIEAWNRFYESPWFLAVFLHNDVKESNEIHDLLKDALNKRGLTGIVAFGHRHQRSLGTVGPLIFEEAPNLATEKNADFGFYLVASERNKLKTAWCPVPPIKLGT